MTHSKHEFITSPTGHEQKDGANPSGHVETEGKVSSVDLPVRNMGPDSIREVFYDHNADLPQRSTKK